MKAQLTIWWRPYIIFLWCPVPIVAVSTELEEGGKSRLQWKIPVLALKICLLPEWGNN